MHIQPVTTVNGHHHRADTAEIAHVAAAERLARAVIAAFESCEDCDVPFSDVQKITVLQALLLEFDGFQAQLSSLDRLGRILREFERT